MPYSLNIIERDFRNEINELNRLIIILSTKPASIERDTHIEGCFIRFVVSWEIFIEEYFLRCLCVGKTRRNTTIAPKGTAFKNKNEAFKKLNKNRRDRNKDYLDWLDSTLLDQRISDYFRENSRVKRIVDSPDKLFELIVIRNAIAHRSQSAIIKFQKYVKTQLGYLATLNPTMAELLIQNKRGTNKQIFITLSEYFLGLADRLTK